MKAPHLLFVLTSWVLTLSAALGVDTDVDGLDDAVETNTGIYVSASNTGTDPSKADTDGDGMSDGYELGIGRVSLSPTLRDPYGSDRAAESSAEDAHLLTLESDAEWEFFTSKILPSLMAAMPAGQTSAWVGAESSTYQNGDVLTWIGSKPWQWHTGKKIDLTRFAPGKDGSPPYYGGRAAFSTTTLNLAETISTTALPSFVELGRFSDPNVKDSRELLFSNADFSSGNLSGWTSEGAGPTFLPDGSVFIQEFSIGGSLYTSQEFLVPVQRGLRGLVFRIFRPAGISSCFVRVRIPADNINIRMKETPYGAFHDCYVDLSDFVGKSIQVGVGGGSVQFSKVEALISDPLFTLALTPASHGTIAGSGAFPSGFVSTLTATPEPGYVFTGWTGNASGATNPLQLVMDANKTVGATFAADLSDADADGLTAYDEVILYHTDPTKADSDNDGLTDAYELGIGRFSVISGTRTWAQAKAHAETQGGTLATFANQDEWNLAMLSIGSDALVDVGGLWIGATDEVLEGTWVWVTGEPFVFTLWETGQPDNGSNSDYAAVAGDLGGASGKWYDYRAATTRDGYIFESGYSTNPSDADSDDDGLLDGTERTAGSNPFNADTDGDTLTDAEEVNLTHTNPTRADSNSNGTNDAADDQDGDGVPNLAEIRTYGTNPVLADTDGDGISDGAELAMTQNFYKLVAGSFNQAQAAADAATKRGRLASLVELATYISVVGKARRTSQGYLWVGLSDATAEGTWKWADGTTLNYNRWLSGQPDGGSGENFALIMENASTLADGAAAFVAAGYLYERTGLDPLIPDTDGDGLNDGAEQNTHSTSPFNDDSDSDGLLDGAEVLTHLSNPNKADTDDDGLTDKQEVETYLTNPAVKDTDSDGFDDLFEINTGFNPRLASSTADAVSTIHTSVEFRFNAANGVSYRIEASTDLNNWASVEDTIIGIGGVVTRFYSIENQPRRFFRVRRN